jgi:hypothetical protein
MSSWVPYGIVIAVVFWSANALMMRRSSSWIRSLRSG